MKPVFTPLHPLFVAEVSAIDLMQLHDPGTLALLRAGMDQHGVLVFHDQTFTDAGQLAFAQRFDGALHTKTGAAAVRPNRLKYEGLSDISNVDEDGKLLHSEDRRRMYALGNRLWHTDASFQDPAGRYSMLSARVVPPAEADTEFADMRAAYDALDVATQKRIESLHVHHSIAHSRQTLGFEFSNEELDKLRGAVHPLVRTNPRTGRRSLYLAAHATRIMEMPVPEGRLLLRDLMDHATERRFVHAHSWRAGDLVIWDNLATMHRGRPYEDGVHRRELRRVTTLDIEGAPAA
ncbi:MAG: TauD/TfdA dioxygenase family protein [bacterium]|nr:TauD/TfdA family dioxygenase [Betaproteobacteria bacterium]